MADTSFVFDHSKHSKKASVKFASETKITRVLLVCVYNQSSSLITHDILYNVFSAHGKINRVLLPLFPHKQIILTPFLDSHL